MEKQVKKTEREGVIYTPIGSNMMPVYERVFNKETGKSIVVQTDEFDIDEYIQASNCQTDLAMLRAEMVSTGQLPVVGDEVVDATLFPENIHELYSTINNVSTVYSSLPSSIKSIFKNKDDFMSSLINGTYASRLSDGLVAYEKQALQAQAAQTQEKEGEK